MSGRDSLRVGVAATLAVLAGCGGAPAAPRLPPAGAINDDGAGQLAQASVQVRLDEDGLAGGSTGGRRVTEPLRYRPLRTEWTPGSGLDPSLGGSVYGLDSSLGGLTYGAGVGTLTWGITGPPVAPRTDGGAAAVTGSVSWRADRGVPWPAGCAGARVARAGGAVAGAVVYLAHAPVRRDRFEEGAALTHGALVADGCALWPAAQALGPVPGVVDVENGSPRALVLGGGRGGVTLEPGGSARLPVTAVAITRLDAGARAPAWVLGLATDYHTVTDGLGRFSLDGVPAGTYELVVWYPPVVRAVDGERPVWTEPTVAQRSVTVGASGVVRLALALDPAP